MRALLRSVPQPCCRTLPTHASAGDSGHSWEVWVSLLWGHCSFLLGPGAHKVLFEPSKCLWWIWGLILNVISPFLPSFWGFSFALGRGVSFFGGIQHFPVDSCSAASCSFGVLAGEDELTSFYFSILHFRKFKKQNLNLPHSNNYLHSIYMILGIKNNLEVT